MSTPQPPRSRQYLLPASVSSVTRARTDVRALLREWRLAAVEDDAALVVTELVGNAVRHGSGEVTVAVLLHDQHLRVEVKDAGRVVPVEAVTSARTILPEQEQGHGESGRGLRIVAALSERWGIVERGGGLLAWCELSLSDTRLADATLHTLSDYRPDPRSAAATGEAVGAVGADAVTSVRTRTAIA
ncbi:MAG: ATP-binding protein [Motilibacteraceae bacterium]